jgi:cell division protein FtsW (lipid II flippase)
MAKTCITTISRLFLSALLLVSALAVQAQDSLTIKTGEVKTWFDKNWLWVAVGVVVVLLLALMGGSKKVIQKRTTTIVKDNDGNVKRIVTTEDTE